MISVDQALAELFALARPTGTERIGLAQAVGRVLAEPVAARVDQPPFRTAMMDGYAIRSADRGARLRIIGEAAAGHANALALGPGEAMRIFTGAPLPEGADQVVMQEDTIRDGNEVQIAPEAETNPFWREIGADFRKGDAVAAPRRLTPSDIALLAAMNIAQIEVARAPTVAILATGDELVMPGDTPRRDQIIASNGFGLAALLTAAGAHPRLLPIARDTEAALRAAFDLAGDADLIVTIGGASVGDHDLVGRVAGDLGLQQSFYKVAMRPGKPLMAGRIGPAMMIGLPGNPVSAMVCGEVFVRPVIEAMLGLPAGPRPRAKAPLAAPVEANGPREHYMRAELGPRGLSPFARQDSGLIQVMARANALLVRPPHDPARQTNDMVEFIAL